MSELSILAARHGVAELITEPGGQAADHIRIFKKELLSGGGDASIQNVLRLSQHVLRHQPMYSKKEIIFVSAALSTNDPGPESLLDTIKAVAADRIRCSVVGLGAEVFILTELARLTGGLYEVALDEAHLSELLSGHCAPPPVPGEEGAAATLVPMGFPIRSSQPNAPSHCLCHVDLKTTEAYICPRCEGRHCAIPCVCKRCGLRLVMAASLAKSFHFLDPLPEFADLPPAPNRTCQGCLQGIDKEEQASDCPRCRGIFCIHCSSFIQDVLHVCPVCEESTKG